MNLDYRKMKLPLSLFLCSMMLAIVCPLADAAPFQSERTEAEVRKEYDAVVVEFREQIKSAQSAVARFKLGNRKTAKEYRSKYGVAIAATERARQKMIPLAIELFGKTNKPDQDLLLMIRRIQIEAYNLDQFERCYELCERLLVVDPTNPTAILNKGLSAIMMGKIDEAVEFKETKGTYLNDVKDLGKDMYDDLDDIVVKHKREMEYRKSDAEGDPLPQVELKTSKGTIVVELFENQAPGTVANFITLVDAEFYDGLIFHRVIERFMAQTGGMVSMEQQKILGYNIYDEHTLPDARHHFRGSLSMANTGAPNSASSQFFINIVPTPGLDGKHTVFGRVISGWEVLDRLNRNVEQTEKEGEKIIVGVTPDKINSARVLSKRAHEYVPNEVKSK